MEEVIGSSPIEGTMKIVFISDTHNKHRKILLPEGDVLVHAGDISGRGHKNEIVSFLHWFSEQPHEHKIFIAGNHDFGFQDYPLDVANLIPNNVIYLENSSVGINGVKFYGSPVQPRFYNWAFNVDRGEAIKKYWDIIPDDTNVLITHGPPNGILDYVENGSRQAKFNPTDNVGCEELRKRVDQLANLQVHVFGHIHEGYGVEKVGNVTFVNASQLNGDYQVVNKPIILEVNRV